MKQLQAGIKPGPSDTNPRAEGGSVEDLARGLCGDEMNGGFIRDVCWTVWQLCHNPTDADGNTDWFNDTLPTVQKAVEKVRVDILALRTKQGGQPAERREVVARIIEPLRKAMKFQDSREPPYRAPETETARSLLPRDWPSIAEARAILSALDGGR